jgi:hypothetical protein
VPPVIPLHISALFIALVFGIAFLILMAVFVCSNRLNLQAEDRRNTFTVSVIVIFAWLMFTLIIGLTGYLNEFTDKPPRILLITFPPLIFILLVFNMKGFHALTSALDSFWFIYPQSFRILMELILILLYRYKVIPLQMTFEGWNFDILIGLTAPVVAYYCFNKKLWPQWVATIWNVMGLLTLANIVTIALLSTPYPFRQFMNEPANTVIFYFPFVWLPGFVVPFAVLLHLLSIRRAMVAKQPQVLAM